ncbi:MAG: hypothetical protein V6Z82_03825, partial [Flavobacteriales bacterium]
LHQRFDELEGPLFQVLKEKEFLVPADRDAYRYLRAESKKRSAETQYLKTRAKKPLDVPGTMG